MLKIRVVGWFLCVLFLHAIGFSDNNSDIEPWISTGDLYNITIDMTTEDIKNKLGDPLFIEAINDDDDIITKFIYNFRTKVYDKNLLENGDVNFSGLSHKWGKTTKIQFVFENNKLISWEEDKLTLSRAEKLNDKSSLYSGFNFLLNIVVITLNAAVLMGQ